MTDSIATRTTAEDAIRQIVGDAQVRAASVEDQVDGVQPKWVIEPKSSAEIASLLSYANANGLKVIARGGGTKLDWGNAPTGAEIVLSSRRMDQVVEHAAGDMTATVQAGCTFGAFLQTLAKSGQRVAANPLWETRTTIGGLLASNDSGPLRATFGPLRDYLIGITVVLADGTVARSGGKVVKNVAGYDLPKLFIGSFGTLGVITEATFRLYPLPQASQTLRFSAVSLSVSSQLMAALAKLSLEVASVQFTASDKLPVFVDVLIEGLAGAIDAKIQRVTASALATGAVAVDAGPEPWSAGERLFSQPGSVLAKVSLLSTRWSEFIESAKRATGKSQWTLIAQAIGIGLLRMEHPESAAAIASLRDLRTVIEKLGGRLTILRCPREIKQDIDVWPSVGDALPLMKRVKQQFDPNNTLSPGRFVGGIE